MKRLFIPFVFCLFHLASCNDSPAPAAAQKQPSLLRGADETDSELGTAPDFSADAPDHEPYNVLLIVADDLGWADLNCYGNPLVKSPNLDALARAGVQFMQAYAAAPVGRPSRLALQTGLSPNRTAHGQSDTDYVTLAEMAQRAGLRTAHIGKWGLGTGARAPARQGYQHVFAAAENHPDSYYYPFFNQTPLPDLLAETKPGDYLTDKLTDHAINLLERWQDSTWLLSLSYYAPHVPLEGRADQVAAYRALVDSTHWRPFPRLEYAAMISVIDENVGRIVATLKATGQLERTLIIFTSDNGGLDYALTGQPLARHTPPTDNGILRAGKGTLYEGGIRVPLIVHFPAWATTHQATLEQVTGTDVFPSVGEALYLKDYAKSPDGRSFLPVLRGETPRLRTLFWEAPYPGPEGPAGAARRGDFKMYLATETDSVTYFNIGALPDESLRMAEPPEGDLLREWKRWRGSF